MSTLLDRLKSSEAFEMIHQEANLDPDLDYEPVSKSGEVVLHYREESTADDGLRNGFTEIELHAIPGEDGFEKVVLEYEWAQEPRMGGGTRYTYQNGTVEQEVTKIV